MCHNMQKLNKYALKHMFYVLALSAYVVALSMYCYFDKELIIIIVILELDVEVFRWNWNWILQLVCIRNWN